VTVSLLFQDLKLYVEDSFHLDPSSISTTLASVFVEDIQWREACFVDEEKRQLFEEINPQQLPFSPSTENAPVGRIAKRYNEHRESDKVLFFIINPFFMCEIVC